MFKPKKIWRVLLGGVSYLEGGLKIWERVTYGSNDNFYASFPRCAGETNQIGNRSRK